MSVLQLSAARPIVRASFTVNCTRQPYMYWTLDLASYLEDAPWPATREELIDYADRTGAPLEVIENLEAMEDDGEPYESIEEVWPDFPTQDDDFYFEDE